MITQPPFWWRAWARAVARELGSRLADIINVAPPEDEAIHHCIEQLIDIEQTLSTYDKP